MQKPDVSLRVAQACVAIAMAVALINGAFMLVNPLGWYGFVPTMRFTGPYNAHFIRDIGAIYLACGVMLLWALPDLRARWLGAAAGGLWLAMHGGIHIYELAVGICGPANFLMDAPGVLGPPALVIVALLLVRRASR